MVIVDLFVLFFKFVLLFYIVSFKNLYRYYKKVYYRLFPRKFKCSWICAKDEFEKEYQKNKVGYDNVVKRMCEAEDKLILEKIKKKI